MRKIIFTRMISTFSIKFSLREVRFVRKQGEILRSLMFLIVRTWFCDVSSCCPPDLPDPGTRILLVYPCDEVSVYPGRLDETSPRPEPPASPRTGTSWTEPCCAQSGACCATNPPPRNLPLSQQLESTWRQRLLQSGKIIIKVQFTPNFCVCVSWANTNSYQLQVNAKAG